jgi:hypothetical protein
MSQIYVNTSSGLVGSVNGLIGNDAVSVGPNGAGFINLVGTGPVLVTGNAGTNTETISVGLATTAVVGVASFNPADFTVVSGAVSTIGLPIASLVGTNGVAVTNVGNAYTVSGINATTTTVGVASFNSTEFTVDGSGRVSLIGGGAPGTVTSVSVVTANGLAGTVATATTTPAITLSTTQTGLLSGNGTAITGTPITQYNVITGAAANVPNSVAPSAASGIPLISLGSATQPAFGTAVVAGGGTGSTTFNTNGVVISGTSTTSPLASLSLTSGQLIIGGTGAPAAGTLTAGPGVSITNGNNSITISTTTGGIAWVDVTTATQALSVSTGYVTDHVNVTYTLPSTAVLGDLIEIVGKLGITTIAQNASQQILMGSGSSTVGITGSVAGTNVGDCIMLRCITAGSSTVWRAQNWVGNWTIT